MYQSSILLYLFVLFQIFVRSIFVQCIRLCLHFSRVMGFSRIFLAIHYILIVFLSYLLSRLCSSELCFRLYIYLGFSINFIIFSKYSLTHYYTTNIVQHVSYYFKSGQKKLFSNKYCQFINSS